LSASPHAESGDAAALHLICGLPCAGKTTLARRLERELPGLRLAPDEWMHRIVGDGHDEEKREAVEAMQWEIGVRVVALGAHAILENGFWSRSERDGLRERARAGGTPLRWYFLDPPLEELRRRLAQRNAALPPDTFHIDDARLLHFATWWEPPRPDELEEAAR
jgi:predicted kinase